MATSGIHNHALVALSVLIAVLTSFTALSLAGRIRASRGWMRGIWGAGASIALGGGIWSMHFVAMLAFTLPGMEMRYDIGLTLVSLALAIIFTGAGFAIVSVNNNAGLRLAGAGLLTGLGVVAMHYVGMAAMQMDAAVTYDRLWLSVSILIAIGAATTALWLASKDQTIVSQIAAAIVMGVAISGMHFAGMRAAIFTAHSHATAPLDSAVIGQTRLAVWVAAITGFILILALCAARLERVFKRYERREARIALRLKVSDILRAGDSPAALDEVAALLGTHFAVSRAGFGQLDPYEDIFDYDVCWTDGSVVPLLGRFPAAAFGPQIVAALSSGQTVVIEDLLQDEMSQEDTTRATAEEVDTRAILVVPFVRDGRLRTIVYLNDRLVRRWAPDDVHFLEEIAERARLVIEREAVEAQLRELNASLEERVQARTAELREAQEALHQSQKMEAVGQLVAGVAHDFNNLLGAVVGSLELISRKAEDRERVRKFAEAGLQAAQRGAKLTSQLLAFSRSGRLELRPLIVCDIVRDMHDLLSRTIGPMIPIEYELNQRPVPVMSDPTQIEMMLLNLAINARDAMPDGGTLRIGTATRSICDDPELSDGDYVEIWVADTGIGMDEMTARRAIEPFFTTKDVGKGTGLGLAQVYGSARQSGGTMRIQSAPGVGTTIQIFLRRSDPESSAESAGVLKQSPVGTGFRTLLIVDDDDDLRRVLVGSLEALEYEVREAANAASALKHLETYTPDAMVIDYAMPAMNGLELAKVVRESRPDMPIVLATGYADSSSLTCTGEMGIEVRHKPFQVDELLETIERSISRKCRVGPETA